MSGEVGGTGIPEAPPQSASEGPVAAEEPPALRALRQYYAQQLRELQRYEAGDEEPAALPEPPREA